MLAGCGDYSHQVLG